MIFRIPHVMIRKTIWHQHILIPIDGSETSCAKIDQAAELARFFSEKVMLDKSLFLTLIAAEYLSSSQMN